MVSGKLDSTTSPSWDWPFRARCHRTQEVWLLYKASQVKIQVLTWGLLFLFLEFCLHNAFTPIKTISYQVSLLLCQQPVKCPLALLLIMRTIKSKHNKQKTKHTTIITKKKTLGISKIRISKDILDTDMHLLWERPSINREDPLRRKWLHFHELQSSVPHQFNNLIKCLLTSPSHPSLAA